MKNKLIRCGIANLFMIPSWILVLFETDILSRDSFRMMGLNNYILDMMHFTLLFFFLYGILPIVLVKLKITKKDRRYSDIII